jgi:histidinol-phosphate aminotransferase
MGIDGSLRDLLPKYPNLMIARTFSKIYGLAGMRIGYCLGHSETISTFMQYHTGRMITPSVCSVYAAMASMDDVQLKEKTLKNNIIGRQMVYQVFDDQGIEYLPSQTSFIFFKTDAFQKNVRKALQQRNVLIRDYRHSPGWARVSIGTPNEMEVFLDEITNLI